MKKNAVAMAIIAGILIIHGVFLHYLKTTSRFASVSPVATEPHDKVTFVSLSPAITEMVYLLGLEDQLAGVTTYCMYPPQAQSKKKIGGYYDPNIELIVKIQPDYVLAGTEHLGLIDTLQRMHVKPVVLDSSTPQKILESLEKIGKLFAIPDRARMVTAQLQKRVNRLQTAAKNLDRPAVMLVFGKQMGGGSAHKRCLVGNDLFYTPLLELAGGVNVASGTNGLYPMVSDEGIIHLNPDIIIELIGTDEPVPENQDELLAPWKHLSQVTAVKNKRIFVMTADYIFIPGPRFVSIAEDFFTILHPDNELPE